MKIGKFFILNLLVFLLLVGCGNENGSKEEDLSDYYEGIKVVNLLDEESYVKNGKKMVEALTTAINAEPEEFYMVEYNIHLLKGGRVFEVTDSQSNKDFYYVGKIKDRKPDGYGVLTNSNMSDMRIYYIGEFDKGSLKNCYGMSLMYDMYNAYGIGTYVSITYEGEFDGLDVEYMDPIIADGKRTIPYRFTDIYNYWLCKEFRNETYKPKNLKTYPYNVNQMSEFQVAKCTPKYIGEIKNGEYHGNGKLFYLNGNLWEEGRFKNDELIEGNAYEELDEYYSEEVIIEDTYESVQDNNETGIDLQENQNRNKSRYSFASDLYEYVINDKMIGAYDVEYQEYGFIPKDISGQPVTEFAFVDLTGDEYPELVLKYGDLGSYVLHYDPEVNCILYKECDWSYTEFLQTNGVTLYSNEDASYISIYTLYWGDGCYDYDEIVHMYEADNICYMGDMEVSEEEADAYYNEYLNAPKVEWTSYSEQSLANALGL